MKCFVLCLICIGLWRGLSSVLAEQFDYECDILQRLDYLEIKIKTSDELIVDLERKVKSSDEVIADIQSRYKEKEQLLVSLENKVTASEKVIADLESKDKEKDQLLVSLENTVKAIEVKATAGTTYVRWGRTSCPGNGSELVYQGVAGGSHYSHNGAAVDYLCLPLDPTYGDYYEDAQQAGAFVFGAEYQFNYRTDRMKFFPDIDASPNLLEQNVPCAVCHVAREAMVMVPAKTSCMPGWTLEYKGLLVTGYYGHAAASEYICLDDQPELTNGGQADENGKLLYFVEGRCGSLPCPPYVDGRELFCAVCTK